MARPAKSDGLESFINVLCAVEGIQSRSDKIKLISKIISILLGDEEKEAPKQKRRGRAPKVVASE